MNCVVLVGSPAALAHKPSHNAAYDDYFALEVRRHSGHGLPPCCAGVCQPASPIRLLRRAVLIVDCPAAEYRTRAGSRMEGGSGACAALTVSALSAHHVRCMRTQELVLKEGDEVDLAVLRELRQLARLVMEHNGLTEMAGACGTVHR